MFLKKTFNTWLKNNINYVFKSFTENFLYLALKNLYMYKSDKKT